MDQNIWQQDNRIKLRAVPKLYISTLNIDIDNLIFEFLKLKLQPQSKNK